MLNVVPFVQRYPESRPFTHSNLLVFTPSAFTLKIGHPCVSLILSKIYASGIQAAWMHARVKAPSQARFSSGTPVFSPFNVHIKLIGTTLLILK